MIKTYVRRQASTTPCVIWGGLDLMNLGYSEYTRKPHNKTRKTGHFGVLRGKSSDCCLNSETVTQSDRHEEKRRMTKHACFQSPLQIVLNRNSSQNLWERQKNISVQCRQCSAILFWNGSRDCSVYTAYASTYVSAHLISTLPVRVKGVKGHLNQVRP